MGQAQAIADNTLVYTVQSTLWALRCGARDRSAGGMDFAWPLG